MSHRITVISPLGLLAIHGEKSITKLTWTSQPHQSNLPELTKARDQIRSYFRKNLEHFDLSLDPVGTPFQKKVWKYILSIPYGHTKHYGAVAKTLRTSPRAIGKACASNPIPLLIPCHRVVGKNGALTGYSGKGGPKTKLYLLTLEEPINHSSST